MVHLWSVWLDLKTNEICLWVCLKVFLKRFHWGGKQVGRSHRLGSRMKEKEKWAKLSLISAPLRGHFIFFLKAYRSKCQDCLRSCNHTVHVPTGISQQNQALIWFIVVLQVGRFTFVPKQLITLLYDVEGVKLGLSSTSRNIPAKRFSAGESSREADMSVRDSREGEGMWRTFGCSLLSYFVARVALGRPFRKLLQPGKERFIVLLQLGPPFPFRSCWERTELKGFQELQKAVWKWASTHPAKLKSLLSRYRDAVHLPKRTNPPSRQGVPQTQQRVTYNSAFFTALPKVPWPQGHTVYVQHVK